MPRKGGFTSYIDPDGTSRTIVNGENVLMTDLSTFKYEDHMNLLVGESIVRKADRVQRYFPYKDARGTQTGCLICTNFKVAFVTTESQQSKFSFLQRNKLISENEIPLCNIDSMFLVSKSGKRKPATLNAKISGKKSLEIRCKDFKVVTFNFSLSEREDARHVSFAIVHHSVPTRLDLLFAFEGCKMKKSSEVKSNMKRYSQLSDWEEELKRLNVEGYRPLMCNTAYSLPGVIVVPSTLSNNHVVEAAQQFIGERPPVWSYSHSNGAALVRMSCMFPETTKKHILERMRKAITTAHPKKKEAKMYDLAKYLSSIKDIKSNFEKLKDLCCPSGEQEVWDKDSSWMSSLESTKWLQVVGDCLQVTDNVSDRMEKGQSVIIQENDSRDLTAVISCLVQLVLDPFSRTIRGFQNLVEKEWVALGHRFTDRCRLVRGSDNEECPLFLLFLDCVWQLTRQYPSAFQFSEIYLIRLWDSVNMGLFDNFIFNGVGDRSKNLTYHLQTAANSGETDVNLMSVWDWSIQYDEDAWSLSNNPLYWSDEEVKSFQGDDDSLHNGAMEHQQKVDSLSSKLRGQKIQRLRVHYKPSHMKLWEGCYLRWISPVEIVRGGSVMSYLSQYILRIQITELQRQTESIMKGTSPSRPSPITSRILSVLQTTDTRNTPSTDVVTSSFPFISGTTPNPVWYSKSTFALAIRSSLAESTEELDKT